MRIRATVVRLTHAKQNHTGNRLPIAELMSNSTPKQANLETECQSLDLHQTPHKQEVNRTLSRQKQQKGWTNKLTGSLVLEPASCQANTHKKGKGWTHRLTGSRELEPDSCQAKHTQKRKRMPGEISHDLLPTYLIWYEDQGDVVPLNRGETSS
jgi:hypothetical protein